MSTYKDPNVRYRGGHPQVDEYEDMSVEVDDELLRLRFPSKDRKADIVVPRGACDHIELVEELLGFERAEAEEGASIPVDASLVRHCVIVVIKDPERVLPEGIRIKMAFRNEYQAKVFAKRCQDFFGVARSNMDSVVFAAA